MATRGDFNKLFGTIYQQSQDKNDKSYNFSSYKIFADCVFLLTTLHVCCSHVNQVFVSNFHVDTITREEFRPA